MTTTPYIPYNPALKERAWELRKNMTAAERKLWFEFLRGHRLRWLRQKPLGNYIVDFYCSEKQLVIEVDGDSHFTDDAQEYDAQRTEFLNAHRLRVLRCTNKDVLERFEAVCGRIEEAFGKEQLSICPFSHCRRKKTMNTPETLICLDDPDMRGAEAIILRAAKTARDEARKAGLTIPVWENGAVVRKHPDELEAEEAARQKQTKTAWTDHETLKNECGL